VFTYPRRLLIFHASIPQRGVFQQNGSDLVIHPLPSRFGFKLVHLAQQERQEGNPQEADGAQMAAKEDREGNPQKRRQRRSLPVEGE